MVQDNVPAPSQTFQTKAEYSKQIKELQEKLQEANERNRQLEQEIEEVKKSCRLFIYLLNS